MFLLSENKVMVPTCYFRDIVPTVSRLTISHGGIFIARMNLDTANRPVDGDRALFSSAPLKRIVVAYFASNSEFYRYWNSDDRFSTWTKGKAFANFNDIMAQTDSMEKTNLYIGEMERKANMLKLRNLGLSNRESEVLFWLTEGKSNGEIADILGLNIGTIKRYLANIFDKLGVETRVGAVILAMDTLHSNKTPMQVF